MRSYYYITGTSRGIGRALAVELLGDEDARVYGIGRSQGPSHPNCEHIQLNLSDLRAVQRFDFPQHEDASRLVLVNNAGTLAPKFLGKENAESIIESYAINVVAPVILMNNFIAAYQERAVQRVICNLSSVAASTAIRGGALYCGAKAALEMTSRVGAVEQESLGGSFRIISVDPGAVDTDMQATLRDARDEDFPGAARNRQSYKDGLLGIPEVVAKQLAQLLRNPFEVTSTTVKLGGSAIDRPST